MQQEYQAIGVQEQHLHDYLAVIFRRWKIAAGIFLIVSLGVTLHTLTTKPVYEAHTTLLVEGSGKINLGLGMATELSSNSGPAIETRIEIIKSRSIAEKVAKRLHLDWQVSGKSKGLDFNLVELSEATHRGGYLVELTDPGSFVVKDSAGSVVGEGHSGVQMKGEGVSLLLTDLHGKRGDSFKLQPAQLAGVVGGLSAGIKGKEIGTTGIIRLSYADTDPARARNIVNAFAQVYVEHTVDSKSQETRKTLAFLEQQSAKQQEELDRSEKNLETYKTSTGIFSLDSEAELILDKLTMFDKQKIELDSQKKQVEFNISSLKDAMKKGKSYVPTDLTGATLANRIDELEAQKKKLLTEFTEGHPSVRAIQQQIDETENRYLDYYDSSIRNLSRQERVLSKQESGYEGQLRGLPLRERELVRLMRLNKVNETLYIFLLQRTEESRIAKAAAVGNVNVVDPALTPKAPIKPNKRKNILLGFLLGAMLAMGSALFAEYLDDTIKDGDEAKRAVGLPLLAVIPYISIRKKDKGGHLLTTRLDPKSPVAEAFRSLRTSLHFSAINRDKKILLLTSTFPGEGKSTVSANLANTLCQTGARVLIIDCDLRRSTLHEKFGHSKAPGLTELLTGSVTFAAARHNLEIQGLDLISAGTTPPNPAELLGSEAMRSFLDSHRDNYDHIIIDAPPVLAVTDAPLLTAMTDMVLVVMEAGRVPMKAALRMREMLATVQAPVTGLVINDKSRHAESYGYYGGNYGSGYYDDNDQGEQKPWWRRFLKK